MSLNFATLMTVDTYVLDLCVYASLPHITAFEKASMLPRIGSREVCSCYVTEHQSQLSNCGQGRRLTIPKVTIPPRP
jgi:hypothetical protein